MAVPGCARRGKQKSECRMQHAETGGVSRQGQGQPGRGPSWKNALSFELRPAQCCQNHPRPPYRRRHPAQGPTGKQAENTKRIPTKYEENTKRIRRQHRGIPQATRSHAACPTLCAVRPPLLLEPVFHRQPANMIKMPDIARYQNEPVTFGGGGNQTIPVAGRCAQRFPLCPKVAGQDCLVELGRRRAGRGMTLGFNSLQNLEDGRVIRNTLGIEVGAIRQTSQLPPTGRRSACPMSGESGTNRLLFLLREALDQFDDVQRRRTHGQSLHSNPPSNKGFLPPQPNVGLGKSQ